jgi:hypothetical protein
MSRTEVATNREGQTAPQANEPGGTLPREEGWRAFLVSWQLGVILLVACVLGLLAIVTAGPFGSPSVSERVSDELGRHASCTDIGPADDAGQGSSIYRCRVGIRSGRAFRCFVVADGDVKQFVGNRRGC